MEIKNLETDLQTRNDLCITQSPYDEYDLASLYNKAESAGGNNILKQWIRNPVSDYQILHDRIESIRSGGIPSLIIDYESLDFIEYYLNYDEPKPDGLYGIFSYYYWLKNKFQNNPWTYVKEQGCQYLCGLLKNLREATAMENDPDLPLPVRNLLHEIGLYLNSQTLISVPPPEKVSNCMEVDRLDYIFRDQGKLAVEGLLDIVYRQDAFRTARRVAKERNFCYPEFVSTGLELDVEGFYHPALSEAVVNDWNKKEEHIHIFTGSNMAGKSTLLKALSSVVWLSQCGLPVPAVSMRCPVYSGMFTSINLPDSLRRGESHFYAEVLRVKSVLQKVKQGKPYFIVFDELFRGTNARDAYEASEAVLSLLKTYNRSDFLISTHIIELANAFYEERCCSFHYMESDIINDRFVCTYKLKDGISESHIGSWLVKKELGL